MQLAKRLQCMPKAMFCNLILLFSDEAILTALLNKNQNNKLLKRAKIPPMNKANGCFGFITPTDMRIKYARHIKGKMYFSINPFKFVTRLFE